jgi:hypothetical protein
MAYEVKTPVLLESIQAARAVIKGLQDGAMEPKEGTVILGGVKALQGAVREDVRARLAAPRIAAHEAKASAMPDTPG